MLTALAPHQRDVLGCVDSLGASLVVLTRSPISPASASSLSLTRALLPSDAMKAYRKTKSTKLATVPETGVRHQLVVQDCEVHPEDACTQFLGNFFLDHLYLGGIEAAGEARTEGTEIILLRLGERWHEHMMNWVSSLRYSGRP